MRSPYVDRVHEVFQGEWFNGKTAAFKVADLGSNPCSPAGITATEFKSRILFRIVVQHRSPYSRSTRGY